jgi:hypothetical protein
MKSSIFLDVTPCSLLKASRRFGGTFRLCLQGERISKGRNQNEAGSKQSFAYSFDPEDGSGMFFQNISRF